MVAVREKHGISNRFMTNGLELKHRLQKKHLSENEVPKEIRLVTRQLYEWTINYYKECRRAIRGIGKYRLADNYSHYFVPPARWCSWSDDRRNQHFAAFLNHNALPLDSFKKLSQLERKATVRKKNSATGSRSS